MFVGSGKLGFPDAALFALALGCDMVNVGREAMMAIGCIQAQRCHTGRCPTGVATQTRGSRAGSTRQLKSVRHATYVRALRGELLALARTCGVVHPALVDPGRLEVVSERFTSAPLHEMFGYEPGWAVPSPARRAEIEGLMGARAEWRAPGPERGPVPGDGTGGDVASRRRASRAASARAGELPRMPSPQGNRLRRSGRALALRLVARVELQLAFGAGDARLELAVALALGVQLHPEQQREVRDPQPDEQHDTPPSVP